MKRHRPELPGDPSNIELNFRHRRHLDRDLDLQGRVDMWRVTASIRSEEDDDLVVGTVRMMSMEPKLGFAALDAVSQDASNIGGSIFGANGLTPAVQKKHDMTFSDRIWILDTVILEPEWRGTGYLGALIAGEAIASLAIGGGLVFAYPYPVNESQGEPDPVDPKAVTKLRRTWRQLGFTHLSHGVYCADLSLIHFEEGLRTLRHRLTGRALSQA